MANDLTDPASAASGGKPGEASPGNPASAPRRFPFLVIVPWLMLAAAMRFAGWQGGALGLVTTVVADLCVLLALLIGTRAMIEWSGGQLQGGQRGFREQLGTGHRILVRVFALLVAMSAAVTLLFSSKLGPYFMMGFDGIAFDQFSRSGMVWSAVLGTMVFLMVVQAEMTGRVSLRDAFRELLRRRDWLVPAMVAIALMQIVVSAVQGQGRGLVHLLWLSQAPVALKSFVYFAFVFCFATLRVWLMLAILTFALRASYRRLGRAVPSTTQTG